VEKIKPHTQKRGCILKKGAKMRMGFTSFTARSNAHVNILMTFVGHKKKAKKFVTVHTMKEGSRGIVPIILNLSTKWRLVFNFTHQPVYPRRKNPRYPLNWKVGGLQTWSGCCIPQKVRTS